MHFSACMVTLVALVALLWRDNAGNGMERSLICPAGSHCSDWKDIRLINFPTVGPRFLQLFDCVEIPKGKLFVSLHIGTNQLDKKDLDMYAHWLSKIDGPYRMIFVEPNAAIIPNLRRAIISTGADENNIAIVNAGVCSESSNMTFYKPSVDMLMALFPSYTNISSLTTILFDSELDEFLSSQASFSLDQVKKQLFATFQDERAHSCVEQVSAPCVAVIDLLNELGVEPEVLTAVIIDAEGYDLVIANQLLAIDRFMPSLLQFEDEHLPSNVSRPIVNLLSMRYYNVYQHCGDLIAIKDTK